jgi:hypothetical protein
MCMPKFAVLRKIIIFNTYIRTLIVHKNYAFNIAETYSVYRVKMLLPFQSFKGTRKKFVRLSHYTLV